MQPPVILRREAVAAGDVLNLLLAIPEQRNLGANRAAIALGAFELELDPVISGATVSL